MSVERADAEAAALDAYAALLRRRTIVVAGLVVACLLALAADLTTGPSGLGVLDTLRVLAFPAESGRAETVIVWQLRLPVAIMALMVGAALALAGAELQTVLANPLASPFTLGISSAASLGAALAIVLGITIPGLPQGLVVAANAFVVAFAGVLLLQAMVRHVDGAAGGLVLFGIALLFTFEAAVSMLQFVATADALQQLVFWRMGSLSRSSWTSVALLGAALAVILPFSLASAWRMTALRLGEDRARSFGIDVRRLRFLALLRISLLSATAVAFVGTIAFVGLVGPHIARLLIGEDHRFFLPASALTGALVMSLASVASKTLVPGVIVPIGIVTALVGLPVFFSLILRQRRAV